MSTKKLVETMTKFPQMNPSNVATDSNSFVDVSYTHWYHLLLLHCYHCILDDDDDDVIQGMTVKVDCCDDHYLRGVNLHHH